MCLNLFGQSMKSKTKTKTKQYFSYIVAVSFIGGVNRSTLRKPPTCRKSLTNFDDRH